MRPNSQLAGHKVGNYANGLAPKVSTRQIQRLDTTHSYLFEIIYVLSNNHLNRSDEISCFDNLFASFPISMLNSLLATKSRTIQVVFGKLLRYLFFRERRDNLEAIITAAAHDHPDWLVPELPRFLFYAAALNCLRSCELLLEMDKATFLGHFDVPQMVVDGLSDKLKWEHARHDSSIFVAVSAGYGMYKNLLCRL